MTDYPIVHQEEAQLFYIALDDHEKAFIKYRLIENLRVDFFSTLVPQNYRGRGLAAKLVDAAFAWADQQGLAIEASCWYAAKRLAQRSVDTSETES